MCINTVIVQHYLVVVFQFWRAHKCSVCVFLGVHWEFIQVCCGVEHIPCSFTSSKNDLSWNCMLVYLVSTSKYSSLNAWISKISKKTITNSGGKITPTVFVSLYVSIPTCSIREVVCLNTWWLEESMHKQSNEEPEYGGNKSSSFLF